MSIAQQYSGIVINQNAPATGSVSLGSTLYTTFELPDDYVRGDDTQIVPPLTGFQLFVNITAGQAATAALTWELALLDSGWQTLLSGTSTGTANDGATWFGVLFEPPLAVEQSWLASTFRLGVSGSGGLVSANIS